MLKKLLWLLVFAFIVIQFFRPEKNVSTDQSGHISKLYPVHEDVNRILIKACNDCHSNNTNYPWYASVQPVAWWLNKHIQDGKKGVNFDNFTSYSLRKQYHKMEEVIEMVKEKEMPLDSYTWIHRDAKLTNEERNTITNWAQQVMDSMKALHPIDSLIRKK